MAQSARSSFSPDAAAGGAFPLIAATPDGVLRGTLSSDEAAEYLGVSVKTVLGWRLRGGGPRATKLGRRVVYRIADLEEFLLAHRESA
ncbi:MAG: helix-turn-helix domain-containing protein [Pseudonocardiaceae bacterium]